jgi:hypothetical protein
MTMTKTTTSSPAVSAAVVVVVLTFMDSKCVFERMLPSTTWLFPTSDGIQFVLLDLLLPLVFLIYESSSSALQKRGKMK